MFTEHFLSFYAKKKKQKNDHVEQKYMQIEVAHAFFHPEMELGNDRHMSCAIEMYVEMIYECVSKID